MVLHDISKGSVVITLSTLRKCNQKFINYSSSLLGSLFVLLDSNLALNLWRVLKAKGKTRQVDEGESDCYLSMSKGAFPLTF